ncbi:hypothetical protein K491DRAFT_685368 [Lophiostoma macrostomum CBS 122681]|uniref:Uncharacterized protein n=1 Tax=Lophiostoma macrostomum CBS 122681 TaxID=1314788 RepID=A0A6A6SIK9_9PLEO|nr:hypothetical protein K491DRAFT_685368 [Lophiostoma macrostomum CBS 122681]
MADSPEPPRLRIITLAWILGLSTGAACLYFVPWDLLLLVSCPCVLSLYLHGKLDGIINVVPRLYRFCRTHSFPLVVLALVTWLALLWICVSSAYGRILGNTIAFLELQERAATFDEAWNRTCPPFFAATCPEILGINQPLYSRLLEPKGRVHRYGNRAQLWYHPDKGKAKVYSRLGSTFTDLRLDSQFYSDVRMTYRYCEDAMSKSHPFVLNQVVDDYPRRLYSRGKYEDLQEWDGWDVTKHLDVSFPRRQRACNCSMDEAVEILLRAALPWLPRKMLRRTVADAVEWTRNALRGIFSPASQTQHQALLPSAPTDAQTFQERISQCPPCSVRRAWTSYTDVFAIEFLRPLPGFPAEMNIALGYLLLQLNISGHSSRVWPQLVVRGFIEERLPPRGLHRFWLDVSSKGLPHYSSRVTGVPTLLTDMLREWGRSDMGWDRNMYKATQELPIKERREYISDKSRIQVCVLLSFFGLVNPYVQALDKEHRKACHSFQAIGIHRREMDVVQGHCLNPCGILEQCSSWFQGSPKNNDSTTESSYERNTTLSLQGSDIFQQICGVVR